MALPASPRLRATLAALAAVLTGPLLALDPAPATTPDRRFVYVSGGAPTITCFQFDAAAASLTQLSSSAGGFGPSFLAWSPDRKYLYAVNGTRAGGRIIAFKINPKDGSLAPLSDGSAGGKGTCHVSVHPSGKWVYSANYGSGHVAVLPVQPDGSLAEPQQAVLAGVKAHQTVPDPSGRFLPVPCLGSDWVATYAIDQATGQLTPTAAPTTALPAKAGPRHLAFRPDGRFVYVLNELASTLTRFTWDGAAGTLGDPQTVPALPAGFTGKNSAAHVVITPDGRFLYASLRGHDSLAIFSLDPATGAATLVGHETGGNEIKTPRNFTVDPTGTVALVASQSADLLTVFRLDPATGLLTRTGSLPAAGGPAFVGVVPAP